MAESNNPEPTPSRMHRAFTSVPLWSWVLLVGVIGAIIGLGGYTFAYAEGASYFSNDPSACVNCHVMQEVYDGWNHGSHKDFAGCNDCHTPHTFFAKYAVKGLNGWNHSKAFTTGNYPNPIRITDLNRQVAYDNCIACHGELVSAISHEGDENPTDCLTCHRGVGHGK